MPMLVKPSQHKQQPLTLCSLHLNANWMPWYFTYAGGSLSSNLMTNKCKFLLVFLLLTFAKWWIVCKWICRLNYIRLQCQPKTITWLRFKSYTTSTTTTSDIQGCNLHFRLYWCLCISFPFSKGFKWIFSKFPNFTKNYHKFWHFV